MKLADVKRKTIKKIVQTPAHRDTGERIGMNVDQIIFNDGSSIRPVVRELEHGYAVDFVYCKSPTAADTEGE